MNHKGQVFVLFVLLLPLFCMLAMYIVDNGIILYEKHQLEEINKLAISYALMNRETTEDKVKEIIRKNEEDVDSIRVNIDESVQIEIKKEIRSIFGIIIGKKNYEITSYLDGSMVDGKIQYLKIS